jgi:FKBP-type peptidyl-prolyl cis-trans isomerase 2
LYILGLINDLNPLGAFMSGAKKGDIVTIHYSMRDEAGEVIESTKGKGPIDYEIGADGMLPAVQEALVGMEKGERKKLKLKPKDAFGKYNDALHIRLNRSELSPSVKLEEGKRLTTFGKDNQQFIFVIRSFDDEYVELDGNHPYAGEKVFIELLLKDIKSN